VTAIGSSSSLSSQNRIVQNKKSGLKHGKINKDKEGGSFLVGGQSNSFGGAPSLNYSNLSGSKLNKSLNKRNKPIDQIKGKYDSEMGGKRNNNHYLKQ